MSLKAIKEALRDYSRITGKADAAFAELGALEKAAKDIGACRAMPEPTHDVRHASIQGFVLLATIAKEAE